MCYSFGSHAPQPSLIWSPSYFWRISLNIFSLQSDTSWQNHALSPHLCHLLTIICFGQQKSFKLSTEQNMQKQTLNFRDSDAFRLSWRCPLNSPQRWSVLSLGVPLVLCLRSAGHAVADSRLFLSWAPLEIGSLERNKKKKDTKTAEKQNEKKQQVFPD